MKTKRNLYKSRSKLYRALEPDIELLDDQRITVGTINTDTIDRYGTIVDPAGCDDENYQKNPVVLYNHWQHVARNRELQYSPGQIRAWTEFPTEEIDPVGYRLWLKYQAKFLFAFSVSFLPLEGHAPTPDEIRAKPDLAECRWVYDRWELLEYSCVDIPGNPDAVKEALARGWLRREWIERLAPKAEPAKRSLPPLVGHRYADVERNLLGMVATAGRNQLQAATREAIALAKGQV